MSINTTLADILLVACDQAYMDKAHGIVPGMRLAEYRAAALNSFPLERAPHD